jgi:hypothetical protein
MQNLPWILNQNTIMHLLILLSNNSPNHGECEQAYLLCGGTIYPSSSTMKYTVAGFSVHYTTTTTLGILGKHSNPHQIVG